MASKTSWRCDLCGAIWNVDSKSGPPQACAICRYNVFGVVTPERGKELAHGLPDLDVAMLLRESRGNTRASPGALSPVPTR